MYTLEKINTSPSYKLSTVMPQIIPSRWFVCDMKSPSHREKCK